MDESFDQTSPVLEETKIIQNDLIAKINIGLLPVLIIGLIVLTRITFFICKNYGQKTRSQPQRRTYGRRGSVPQQEPTIFVSPGNYPPPPKYEHMAPPSYEEVVGIHYPNYPPSQFPITRPLAVALAQNNEMSNGTTSAANIVTASTTNNIAASAANNVIACTTNNVAASTTNNVTVRTSNANEQTNNGTNNVPSVTVATS